LCQSEGAELWEILDGEPEWEAVLAKVKTDQYSEAYEYGIWINGKVKQGCQGSFPFQKSIKPTTLKNCFQNKSKFITEDQFAKHLNITIC
jgi:hypothetical protein